jgi:lipopolysaccharide transport system ATP-binding protein
MYSSGMFARLAFSVAINVEPDVLIVDEALSVGDEKFQRKCYAKIEQMSKNGCTILFVTHSTSLLESICTSGLLLIKGRLDAWGESKYVVEKYRAFLYGETERREPKVDQQIDIEKSLHDNQDNKEANKKFLTIIDVEKQEGIKIHKVWIKDVNGDYSRNEFSAHETIYVGMQVKAYEDVRELMVGIRIKTIEGVEVFGGSSDYIGKNIKNIAKGTLFDIEIKTTLALCDGHYFVTLAVADKNSVSGMVYQDKLVDIIDFRVVEQPMRASGIVSLQYDMQIKKV